MSIRKNVIANYVGQGSRGIAGLAFVPLYIKYLGIEAYGLIGIFAVLQAWLILFDMGMAPALAREMARFTAGAHDSQSIRTLLRSIEIIIFAIAIAVALAISLSATWLASEWLQASNLRIDQVTRGIALMGCVTGLRFVEDIYVSCLSGLQLQVLSNAITGTAAIARAAGAIGILAWLSPTIEAFFIWQVFVSLVTVIIFWIVTDRTLPAAPKNAQFSFAAVSSVWQFAAGMTGITFLALLLTQLDKILLSRLLPLAEFAQYALASAVAGALYLLMIPITAAFYPKLTELVARQAIDELISTYHHGAQLVTVIAGAAAIILIMFGNRLLLLWTGDAVLSERIAPLLQLLSLGTLLNGLNWIPYQLQLAYGWTQQGIKINLVAVAVLVPTIFWAVPRFGAIGAAYVWVALNLGYLIFAIYFMHRRLLQDQKWLWYIQDVAMPLLSATLFALLCTFVFPAPTNTLGELVTLLTIFACTLIVAALAAPILRNQILYLMRLNGPGRK